MLMLHRHPTLQFTHPCPTGDSPRNGVQFVVFSRSATAMRLLLYEKVDDRSRTKIIAFDRETDRWGDIWSIFVPASGAGQLYHFQADGPHDPEHGQWFDGKARLIDPYAKALAGNFLPGPTASFVRRNASWSMTTSIGKGTAICGASSPRPSSTRRTFAASRARPIERRQTSRHVSRRSSKRFRTCKSLGVTAVELMPVHEFPTNGILGETAVRPNYWGYDPLAFFAPHRGYAVGEEPGSQVNEFKQMVKALHAAGMEVILDVVFNHTCEGNELGPTLSFKGLENQVYYMLGNGGGYYTQFSGCGNTVNGNHPDRPRDDFPLPAALGA